MPTGDYDFSTGRAGDMTQACYLIGREIQLLRQQLTRDMEPSKPGADLARIKTWLDELGDKLMASQQEIAAELKLVTAQLKKTQGEIADVQTATDALKEQVAALEKQVAGGGTVTQELIDAVAEVKAQAQVIDDAIPDVPTA